MTAEPAERKDARGDGPALRGSEERYRALVLASAQVVWTTTADGEVVEDLPTWREFTGQSFEQMKGRGWMQAIHPEDRDRAAAVWARSPAQASAHEQEFRVRAADGAYRHVLARAVSIKAADGSVAEWVGTCQDVTERMAAEEAARRSDERYRLATEAVWGVVFDWDLRSGHIDRSAGLAAMLGFSAGDAEPTHEWWRGRVHPDDLGGFLAEVGRVLHDPSAHLCECEYRVMHRDGAYRWIYSRGVALRDEQGRAYRFVGTHADVTSRRRAEEAVRASADHLRLVCDTVPVFISNCDLNRRFKFVNRAYAERFGLNPRELTGRHLAEVLGGDAYQAIRPYIDRVLTGSPVEFELEIPYAALGRRWMQCRYAPEVGEGGRVRGWVSVILDMTARKEAEEAMRRSEERLRAVFTSSVVGMGVLTVAGRFLEVNEAFCDITGYCEDELLALDCAAITYPDDAPAVDRRLAEVRRGERPGSVFENRYVRKDGRVVWVLNSVSLTCGHDGGPDHLVVLCQDVTARREAEQRLRGAKEAAEAASRAKDQFLAVLSHELRTPLTPVVMALGVLQAEPGLSPQVREDLKMIRRNIELETRIIDDLLDISRVANGKLSLRAEPLALTPLLKNVMEIVASEVHTKRLAVRWDLRAEHDRVRGDAARLQQVLWNLLTNAVKFTPAGGTLTLRTWNDEKLKHLCVEVQDTGAGIEQDVLPRVFDAFDQGGPGVTRQFGGLGLGLAITRALVEMHGGQIRVHSEGKGKGTRFVVTLATCDVVERIIEKIQAAAGGGPPGRLRVLLVEDHADTLRVLRRVLEIDGYAVSTATSVASARALLAGQAFDLVVSDIGLPDGTGTELLRQARRDGLAVPAVAVTGYGMEHDVQGCLEAGFSAHLTKPVDLSVLQATLRRLSGSALAETQNAGR